MSKAFDICEKAADKFSIEEASSYFICTVCRAHEALREGSESTAREKIRAIAKLKNSLAIFIIANRDAIMEHYVLKNEYKPSAPSFGDVVDTLKRNIETMPRHKWRGFNVRLSMALGGLTCCITEAERKFISCSEERKKRLNTEQWDDLLRIKRSLTHYANF